MAEATVSLRDLRVGIVGLGLMGGSLALALRTHVAYLQGIERRAVTRQMAERDGIVDVTFEALASDVPEVDLLILATPARAILETLAGLPQTRSRGCSVMDLGSTKQAIVATMSALPASFAAIGGHPMCGRETSGLAAATADLYQDQTFVLCRTARTTPAVESLVHQVIEAIGARALYLEPVEHDAIVARVSHLPYVLSAALMRLSSEERQWAVSASGFQDTSRLSGTDPRMMLDILLTNRRAILAVLDDLENELTTLSTLLAREDETSLTEWLATAQVHYAAYRRFRSAGWPFTGDGRARPTS